MRFIILLPIISALLLCCAAPEPAAPEEVAEVEQLATCHPSAACDLQGPCTCPNGFTCAYGICARSVDPWFECYNNNDCIITSPAYSTTCFTPVCYMFTGWNGQPESGCGWNTRVGGTCAKPTGGTGTCAPSPNDGDCI